MFVLLGNKMNTIYERFKEVPEAQIGESGEHFNETIEVDTERQTELFKVPAHGNVDHSNILNDFKTVSIVTIIRKIM